MKEDKKVVWIICSCVAGLLLWYVLIFKPLGDDLAKLHHQILQRKNFVNTFKAPASKDIVLAKENLAQLKQECKNLGRRLQIKMHQKIKSLSKDEATLRFSIRELYLALRDKAQITTGLYTPQDVRFKLDESTEGIINKFCLIFDFILCAIEAGISDISKIDTSIHPKHGTQPGYDTQEYFISCYPVSFTVEGSYKSLWQLIHLLQTEQHFVALNQLEITPLSKVEDLWGATILIEGLKIDVEGKLKVEVKDEEDF